MLVFLLGKLSQWLPVMVVVWAAGEVGVVRVWLCRGVLSDFVSCSGSAADGAGCSVQKVGHSTDSPASGGGSEPAVFSHAVVAKRAEQAHASQGQTQ